jgi:hypothetical protein
MKIEWSTMLSIVLALVVFKIVDKFVLSKIGALNLEEEL